MQTNRYSTKSLYILINYGRCTKEEIALHIIKKELGFMYNIRYLRLKTSKTVTIMSELLSSLYVQNLYATQLH